MIKSILTLVMVFFFSMTTSFGQDVYNISGSADGTQEVPPNGSTGTATISGTYDQATGMITLNIPFSNLVTGITGAHIHGPAAPGMNAGVLIPLTIPAGNPVNGVISGSYAVPPANEADLLAGNTYLNIHTLMQSPGEIRGQIAATIEVVPTLGEWAIISLALLMAIFGVVFICQPKYQLATA